MTGKINAAGNPKMMAGKEKRTPVGQGREKTTVKNKSGICPVADKCGGCSWINQPYAEQLKKKGLTTRCCGLRAKIRLKNG